MVANSLTVKPGQKVQPGARLGIMGTTGDSIGKHLHLEILKGRAYRWSPNGKGYLDPLKFIKATIKNWEIQQAAPQATPDDGVVEPAPVHGSSPSVSKSPVLPIKRKSVATLANEVIAGKWGNGAARIKKLNSAGHNAKAVQTMVNKILSGKK
jgi:murein DD-endopeptidase MepM/ murein hydrolase activator NlpD